MQRIFHKKAERHNDDVEHQRKVKPLLRANLAGKPPEQERARKADELREQQRRNKRIHLDADTASVDGRHDDNGVDTVIEEPIRDHIFQKFRILPDLPERLA
ncbi:hypothetical protein D3C84_852520 [compost metagenome]